MQNDPYDDNFLADDYFAEVQLIQQELSEYNEAMELCNEDGWFYSDDDD